MITTVQKFAAPNIGNKFHRRRVNSSRLPRQHQARPAESTRKTPNLLETLSQSFPKVHDRISNLRRSLEMAHQALSSITQEQDSPSIEFVQEKFTLVKEKLESIKIVLNQFFYAVFRTKDPNRIILEKKAFSKDDLNNFFGRFLDPMISSLFSCAKYQADKVIDDHVRNNLLSITEADSFGIRAINKQAQGILNKLLTLKQKLQA